MFKTLVIVTVVAIWAMPVEAVKVGDITRLSGQRSNVLTGLGLVVGLQATGDGGESQAAIRPLAQMLAKLNNNVTPRELADVTSVALVSVIAVLPAKGVAEGDTLDVYVNCLGAASSLKGGRLFVTPLTDALPSGEVYALAQGNVVLEDPSIKTSGVVTNGAVMEKAFKPNVVSGGKMTLILHNSAADWTTASTIAKVINDAEGTTGENLADARDSKTIEISVPAAERQRPDSFIARIQRLPVPQLPTTARVLINEKTGTIILTGDVEISPVVISHKGLTIQTTTPAPAPSARNPVTTEKRAVAIDTTKEGGAKLQDLVDALDLIRVPAEDRIQIIKELHRVGKLHAELTFSSATNE